MTTRRAKGEGAKLEEAPANPQLSTLAALPSIGSEDFVAAVPPQPLAADEIHLWFFPQWEKLRDATQSPAVRAVLAGYSDRSPHALRIDRNELGKPRLADGAVEFNLSHTGDALLLSVTRDTPVGVDLENVSRQTRSLTELAQRWYAPSEAAAIAALPESSRHAAFLRLWTCKEAVLKCLGVGIGFGLERAEFLLRADGFVCALRTPPAPGAWHVVALNPDAAHVGALAWRGKPLSVRSFVTQAIAARAQSG
jgi:4'-phosphopantetheinyl transferase